MLLEMRLANQRDSTVSIELVFHPGRDSGNTCQCCHDDMVILDTISSESAIVVLGLL